MRDSPGRLGERSKGLDYGLGVGFTGLVFGIIGAVWLLYLVPVYLNRRDNGLLDEVEPGQPFSPSVTIVRRDTAVDSAEASLATVSTPLNRRAALYELTRIEADAARRRRLVLLFLLVVTTLLGGAAVPGWVPWWNFLLPVGLIVAFLAVARFSVKAMREDLAARAALIRAGESVDEETVALKAELVASEETGSVQLGAPVEMTATLWDPIPVSAQTYVSKPLAPRTVRTIDLSSPASPAHAVPVTADAPASESAAVDAEQSPRAVGE